MEKISGERPDLWLYIHGPAHYQAITAKRKAGVLLPAAETFTTFDKVINGTVETYPRAAFDKAWMSSIYPDHGWGGKNGEITDSIFRARLESAQHEGAGLLNTALTSLAANVKTKKNAIVVFNDLTWERKDVVHLPIEAKDVNNTTIKDFNGKNISCQIINGENGYEVVFVAEQVPSLGYKTYYLATGKPADQTPASVRELSNYYENDFYQVTLGDGGLESLFDKQLNKEVLNTTKFAGGDILNVGYYGNGAGEFTQSVLPAAGDLTAISGRKALWKVVEKGPVCTVYENRQPMNHTEIVQQIKIYHTFKKIDFNITLVNFDGTHNRQYRIAVPLNMTEKTISYEVPMGIVQVGKDEMKNIPGGWEWGGTYTQRPEEIMPREIQNFISANGNGFGVTLSSCVAVADWVDPSREMVDYPVLQGILLSSHKSCHGEGNWYEQKGRHTFNFSLLSHAEGWENGYCFGIEANHPLKVIKKAMAGGTAESAKSFINLSDPFVALSVIKKADKDNNIIIRLTEMRGKDTQVKIELPFDVKKVIRTNLIEEEGEVINVSGKLITLPVGHHAIETFKLIR